MTGAARTVRSLARDQFHDVRESGLIAMAPVSSGRGIFIKMLLVRERLGSVLLQPFFYRMMPVGDLFDERWVEHTDTRLQTADGHNHHTIA